MVGAFEALADQVEDSEVENILRRGGIGELCTEPRLKVLIKCYLSKDKEVLNQVTTCLKSSLDHQKYEDGPPKELLSEETLDFIANELMPAFKALLEAEELREVAVLERWQVLVRLMGRHLHTRNATINAMMTVVERAFKLTDQLILAAAFKAWQHLMDCFALDPKILTNPKRINLLVRPFTIKNVKTESGYRSKLESWWHLIHLLGEDISRFGPTVVVPFLSFCFITKAGTEGKKEVGSTPQSPAKRHSMLSKLCLEALVQVVGLRPFNQALPFSLPQLPCPGLTSLQQCESAQVVVTAALEALSIVNPGNRTDLLRVDAVWAGIASSLGSLSSASTQTTAPNTLVQEGIAAYFAAVRDAVVAHRRQPRLLNTLVSIVNGASQLPARLLNSCTLGPGKRRPSLCLLELLLYPDFLTEATEHADFKATFLPLLSSLSKTLLSVSPSPLADVRTLLDKLEASAPGLPQSSLALLDDYYSALVEAMTTKDDLVAAGEEGAANLSIAVRLLTFPHSHLSPPLNSGLWKVWNKFYENLNSQVEVTVGLPTAHLANLLGSKMSEVLGAPEVATAVRLAQHLRSTGVAVRALDLPSLATSSKTGGDPLSTFRRFLQKPAQPDPLGAATPLFNHLSALAGGLACAARDLNVSSTHLNFAAKEMTEIIGSLSTSKDLVDPLTKVVSKLMGHLVDSSVLHPSLGSTLASTYSNACNLLKIRHPGPFDEKLLVEVEPLLSSGLRCKHRLVRKIASETWAVTFAGLPKDSLPDHLQELLKTNTSPCKSGRAQVASSSEASFPSSNSSEDSFLTQVTAAPGILPLSGRPKRSAPLVSSPSSAKKKMPAPAPQEKKKTRKSLGALLGEEDSQGFVVVKPSPKRTKRVLTEHQKDVLTSRHDDIPALYSELSRDDSIIQLPAEFQQSQDSLSSSQSLQKDVAPTEEKPPASGNPVQPPETEDMFEASVDEENVSKEKEAACTENIEEFDSEDQEESMSLLKKAKLRELKNRRYDRDRVVADSKAAKFDPMEGTPSERTSRSPLRRRIKPLRLRDGEPGEKVESLSVEAAVVQPQPGSSVEIENDDRNEISTLDEVARKIQFDTESEGGSAEEEVIESSQVSTAAEKEEQRSRRSRRSVLSSALNVERSSSGSPASSPKKKVPAVERKNKFGEAPLHLAAKKGDAAKVKELLEAGASPNVEDAAGWRPLHEAACSNSQHASKVVQLLVQHGAEVDVCDQRGGVTPLHDAVSFGSMEVVNALLEAGARADVKNAEGKTALDLATDPDLLRAVRKHLDLESPEKCPLAGNASTIEPESANDVASCAAEVTKVDETLDIMFTDQENAELETVKQGEEVEKCERSRGEAEEINSADEKSPEAVIEEGVSEGEDRAELKDKSQAQDPLAENFDEVEEVSALPVENMDVDSSEEGLERKSEEASSNATPVSPDSNKENLGSSSEGGSVSQEKTEEDKDRSPIMALGGLRKPKNPFTELRRSTSSSRAAMLVSLATGRRPSLDVVSSPSPPLLSPKVPNDNQKRPWVKYAPSPSSASPTTSCLKRSADELDSSIEGSPVSSAKRPRTSSHGPRKVHFPENPVSDSVEIPRAPEGKHTRKKLQLWHAASTEDSRRETLSTSPEQTDAVIFPELADCQEPISSISHRLATGPWAKVLEEDLKKGGTTKIGQLASMTCAQVKQLRGLKPPKEVTVRNTLRGIQSRLRMKAPVVEATISTEEEDKIKDELFSRPSPTPEEEGKMITAEEEGKRAEGTLSPALSPIHSPVQRLHEDAVPPQDQQGIDQSVEHVEDESTPQSPKKSDPSVQDSSETPISQLSSDPNKSKPEEEDVDIAEGGALEVPGANEELEVESHDLFNSSQHVGEEGTSKIEEAMILGADIDTDEGGVKDDQTEGSKVIIEASNENEDLEVIEDARDIGKEEPKDMVKLVFNERKSNDGQAELTSGQPRDEVFRSLSATASDDNVMSVNKEEARDIFQGGEGEKAAEVVEQNKEEDVVLQKDVFPTQQVDHLKAWVADASPSDRLRLMKHIVDLQAQILNLHTE